MTKEERSIYNKKYSEKNKEKLIEYRKSNSERVKKRSRTKEVMINKIYNQQRINSKKRNHEMPTYTKEELIGWMFNQPNFEELYNNWVKSNYNTKLKPSVDRLDDYKGYSFNNIRLTTWDKNNKKQHEDRKNGINNKVSKAVLQFTKEGEFVKEWFSMKEAKRHGFHDSHIGECCNGKRKKHAGFIWKYKNKTEEINE